MKINYLLIEKCFNDEDFENIFILEQCVRMCFTKIEARMKDLTIYWF